MKERLNVVKDRGARWWAMAVCGGAMMLATLGCDKKGGEGNPEVTSPDAGVVTVDEGEQDRAALAKMYEEAKRAVEDGGPITEKQYDVLVLSLATCEVDEERGYVDSKCEAFETLRKARMLRNPAIPNMAAMWNTIGERALTDESPAVRIYAAQLLGATMSSRKAAQTRILDLARQETSPGVLQALIRSVRINIGKEPDVAKLLLELSKHENASVRESVVVGLTSLWATGAEGTLERALEMIDSDPSMKVRKTGCANLGSRADDAAMPLLDKYTAWPPVEEELYGDCFRGLIGMWSAPSPHKRPSKAAYELSMTRLQEKPRSDKRPPWIAVAGLAWANRDELLEHAAWIDPDAVHAVLVDLISDHDFSWLGRNAAITTLLQLDGTREDLEKIRATAYNDVDDEGTSPDKYVLNKLKEEITRLDEDASSSRGKE